jgi:transposase-like protein
LVLTLQESYLQGVSTRKIKRITKKLCGVEFRKDQVSCMAQALDQELGGWRSRPLIKKYPYLVMDERCEFVREDGHTESEEVLTVKGIDESGYLEIPSVRVASGEDEAGWGELLADLLERELQPQLVCYVVSDEHIRLRTATRHYLLKATWQ